MGHIGPSEHIDQPFVQMQGYRNGMGVPNYNLIKFKFFNIFRLCGPLFFNDTGNGIDLRAVARIE